LFWIAMSYIRLNIIIQDAWRDRFEQVVEDCRRVGLLVEREMRTVGLVSGSIDSPLLDLLERVEGVGAIEIDRQVKALD